MSIITDLTRMWLTRSVKPFIFRNEYDQVLPYEECQNLGLYVQTSSKILHCKVRSFSPYGKQFFTSLGKEFFTSYGKEILSPHGKEFFT